MTEHVTIGMSGNEIFFVEVEDGKLHCGCDGRPVFCVIRPVSAGQLDDLRTDAEQLRDLWVCAVQEGQTDLGLQDWFDACMDEVDDDESWPFKDDSFVNYLSGEDRARADDWLEDQGVMEVGAWEASGCYRPEGGFDLVFCDDAMLGQVTRLMGK